MADLHQARILVRGVNWLGDAVMTTPALLRLREAFPKAFLALLTPEKLTNLWLRHPALDQVLSFSPDESAFSIGRRLRSEQFQIAIVFPNSFRSALEATLGRIPCRVGYFGQWRRWLLTHPVPPRPGAIPMHKRSAREIRTLLLDGSTPIPWSREAHHLHQYLFLTAQLGADPRLISPQVAVSEDEVATVLQRFDLGTNPSRLILGLNPGAEYGPAKRWPVESFIQAAREIHVRTGCCWIILGGSGDHALAELVLSGINSEGSESIGSPPPAALNLAGKTSLRELCVLLKACRVVLTNDTGPMHLAAAVGTPVVVPFGSTSAELTGPGLPGDPRHALLSAGVPCSPCFLRNCPVDFRCMRQIQVAQVVENVCRIAGLAH